MERHRCKLCHRRFSNGKALGGHMRSHMMSLPLPPKPSYETESSSSSSSSSSDSEEEDDDVGMIEEGVLPKLRYNPRKSIKLADLEDRESETESTRNPTRRRSKRRRKQPPPPPPPPPPPGSFNDKEFADISEVAEPVSSVSEVTSEEDVAFCLMMLSRDRWASCHGRAEYGDIIIRDDVTDSYTTTTTTTTTKRNNDSIYRCETCNKVFRSYQALGGHRASHKRIRPVAANAEPDPLNNNNNNNKDDDKNNERPKKIHECPVCLRVFASGQALGGHKRSHANDNNQLSNQSHKKIKISESNATLIDLNLPAPLDDDDYDDDHDEISQFTVSAVFDAH